MKLSNMTDIHVSGKDIIIKISWDYNEIKNK